MSKMGIDQVIPETQSEVTVGATSTEILPDRNGTVDDRAFALITNNGAEPLYLAFGKDAVLNEGVRVNAVGGSFQIDLSNSYRGIVNGISASGGLSVCVFEATY